LSAIATEDRPRAWVTGAGGLIGSYLVRLAVPCAPQWEVIALTREKLDLTDFHAVQRRFRAEAPRLVIHCAAMSRSPDCEADPAQARAINVQATGLLAELAAEAGLIFFSTDLVFDGKKGNYVETDAVNPRSVYAETKVAAEGAVLRTPGHAVIRTSLNSGVSPKGSGYNEQLRAAWAAGKTVKLFHDEFRCPIPAEITARAVWALVADADAGREQRRRHPGQAGLAPSSRPLSGIWHLAGAERLSRLQIGRLVAARHPELKPHLESGSLRDYPGPPRPADTSLNCAKTQAVLPFQLPGLTAWLRENAAPDF
jgi:dTDP-4-dehydrorhamnose reductase